VVEQSQEKWRPVFRPALRQKKLAEQSPRKVEAGFPSGFANMTKQISDLLDEVRSRFAHVDECPFTGPRVFFENAGGALTLKSAVETSAKFAAIPDNQGRDNPASHALVDVINTAKAKMRLMFNAPGGQFFVGESGTELLFRIIRTAIVGAAKGGAVIGTTLEHPASRSAATYWASEMGCDYISVPHDNATGTVTAQDYARLMTPDVRVATITCCHGRHRPRRVRAGASCQLNCSHANKAVIRHCAVPNIRY
jgi:selenocysteine lyase/cysteine desulfurase